MYAHGLDHTHKHTLKD